MAIQQTIGVASRSCRAAVLLLLGGGLCAPAAPASAQELGLELTAGWTDLPQFEAPRGVGARMMVFPLRHLGIELGYTHLWSRSRFDGITCAPFPSRQCTAERVEGRARVGSVSVSALVVIPVGPLRLQAGMGLSQSVVRAAELFGLETSRTRPTYFEPETLLGFLGKPNGTHFVAGVDHAAGLGLPLRVRLAYEKRRVDWGDCWYGGAEPNCDEMDWERITLGVFYAVGADRSR